MLYCILVSTYGLYPLGPVLPSGSLSGTDQILAIGSTGNFYVLDLSYKDVVIASPDGTIIASYDPSADLITPIGMCLDPSNNVWITDASINDEKIWGVNVATGQIINIIPVSSTLNNYNARNCKVDNAGQFIYVCSAASNTAGQIYKYALNSTTGTPVQTFSGTALGWCMDLIIDPATGNIWNTNYYVRTAMTMTMTYYDYDYDCHSICYIAHSCLVLIVCCMCMCILFYIVYVYSSATTISSRISRLVSQWYTDWQLYCSQYNWSSTYCSRSEWQPVDWRCLID